MVLKGTKRSLRTGNTLRNVHGRQTNKHASSVIVRHVTNFSRQATDEADDSHLTADAVAFSLNKKGRWKLPEVIEENINDADSGDVAVSLLRRHRVNNRRNDCLSITASTATDDQRDEIFQRKKARRKTYCNGLNVLHNGRGKSTKDSKKKQVVSTKKDLAQRKPANQETPLENTDPDLRPTPEVRYDVFYPIPTSSSLRFHPKLSAPSTVCPDGIERCLSATAGVKANKGSHQRHKHIDYEFFQDEEDFYDYWDDEDYYEDDQLRYAEHATEDHLSYDHPQTQALRENLFLFSDVVEQALEVTLLHSTESTDRKKKSRRAKASNERGGLFFYRPEIEDDFDSCLEDGQSETSSEPDTSLSTLTQPAVVTVAQIPSVTVQLCREATCHSRLAEQYGPKYTEAACLPRKMILDISDRVQTALTTARAFNDVHVPSLDLTTYIIFTYTCPSTESEQPENPDTKNTDINSAVNGLEISVADVRQYDIFRVQLNMNWLIDGFTFDLPGEVRKFDSVDDVLQQVVDFITTLSPKHLARHPCEAYPCMLKSRLRPDFHTVAEANGWKASCVSLLDNQTSNYLHTITRPSHQHSSDRTDQAEIRKGFSMDSAVSPAHRSSDLNKAPQVKASNESYCNICFEDVFPGSLNSGQATALSQCRHWFCDTCWQSHMWMSVREAGGRKLQCPEFHCEVEVDVPTLLSLLHVRDVMLQQRRCVELKVTRMFLCKWCPNPHCGRVVQLPHSPSKVVAEPSSMSCPCGQQFCVRCHGDPHWPLSCEGLTLYHDLLRKSGDLHLDSTGHFLLSNPRVTVVKGKSCPSCQRFIEKNGGCPYMSCVCGFNFWWCCRKPANQPHTCPSRFQVTDTTNTTTRVIREVKRRRAQQELEWYETAVHHRSAQHPKPAKEDYRRADQIRRKLQALYAKGVDIGVPMALADKKSVKQIANSSHRKPDSAERTKVLEGSQSHPQRIVARGRSTNQICARLKTDNVSTPSAPEHVRQYIKQTTCAMSKLKMEVNNVLENTAALLHLQQEAEGSHNLSSASVRKIKEAMDDLKSHNSSLNGLLGAESRYELTHVLPWFLHLQRNVKDSLTTLASLVN